jgi:hypothetical protein
VVEVFKDFQTLLNDGVALVALDVRNKADTAGIVLVGTRVQTVLFKMLDFSSRGHGRSLSVGKQKRQVGAALLSNPGWFKIFRN